MLGKTLILGATEMDGVALGASLGSELSLGT